jgi:hypothetical protein
MPNQITPAQTFNKFSTVKMVQEYVPTYGWADVGEATSSKDAKETMADYKAEGITTRVVNRRELNKDAFLCQALLKFCRDYYFRCGGIWPNEVQVLKANGKVKFTLTLKEIVEVLGDDCRIVTSVAV